MNKQKDTNSHPVAHAISSSPGTRAKAKEEKRAAILQAALSLFGECGIENISMEQISIKAGIGSATIYRYFPTKAALACACSLHLWQELEAQYLDSFKSTSYSRLTGLLQLEKILSLFPTIYEEHASFLKFLMDFDNYIQNTSMPKTQLAEYEGFILALKEYATAAIQKGIDDNTIFCTHSVDEIYFTIFHCMLSTTQKMALQLNLLSMDLIVSGKAQLNLLIELLLAGLSKPEN